MRTKKAIKNIITSLMLQIITVICGFIVPRLIIGTFGSNVNGLISSITQFLTYITLLESGFGPVVKALLYKPIANKDKENIKCILKSAESFFRKIAIIFIIYIVILCVVYPLLVNSEFDSVFTISLIIIISISTFIEYFFGITYKIYLQAEQKTYITSYIQIFSTILNTIMIIILIKFGANIQIVKLGSALVFVFKPILQNIYIRKKYKIDLKNVTNNYQIKQKWDGLAQHIAYVIHGNTDIAILTIFANIKEVSVYSVYLLIINGIKNLVQAFTGGIDASFGDMIVKKEEENLRKKFGIYELFYHTLISIVFIAAINLIVPFVGIYTKGITDVNYIRPIFAKIIVIAEFMWAIRLPYNSITLAAGHFKETRTGAWIEALSNIIISIILVFNFGIVGVAIGTLVAMTIRTIEFIYHSSKYILKRSIYKPFLRLLVIASETITITFLCMLIPMEQITSYIEWAKYAVIIVLISSVIIIPINLIIYKNDAKESINIVKNILKKNKN